MKPKSSSASFDIIEGQLVSASTAIRAPETAPVLFRSAVAVRSVSFAKRKRSTPPVVSIQPEQALAIIEAAESQRDRLLLMALWQTGARVSEALALSGGDIDADALWLRNLKQGTDRPDKRPVPLPSNEHQLGFAWQAAKICGLLRSLRERN